jgi:hypothetical protein
VAVIVMTDLGDAPSLADALLGELLQYRWQTLADELAAAGEMPVLGELMRRLLAVTEGWHVPSLPGYPAFRPAR